MCYFHCVIYYLIITAAISISIVYFIWKRVSSFGKMSLDKMDEPLSDDEVYFGKLTLKELKKHILWDKQPKIMSAVNSPRKKYEDQNTSFKILEAHSQPNLLSCRGNSNFDSSGNDSEWEVKASDDSFIKMENMVENLCVSTRCNEKTELNNTLEVIEYILNNPPSGMTKYVDDKVNNKMAEKKDSEIKADVDGKGDMLQSPQKNYSTVQKNIKKSPEHPQITPVKSITKLDKCLDGFTTPMQTKSKPIFKTPAQPLSVKKPSATSLKKTPSKSNPYQHISSPVASYIKNCPIAPLVKEVHPKKPLPGPSSIPKIVKNTLPVKPSNKENINLPAIAYKSAKKTKVIDVPDDQKLPQSQWAKKLMTSLPRPMVMKHNHREVNVAKKKIQSQTEDSFADLSYHQAEVSVCTQKSAFKANKN